VAEYPGRQFTGEITRTSSALDPSTRTLVIEVQVDNPNGTLFPGMFSEVTLNETRPHPPILIPADALVVRSDGAFAAVLKGNGPEIQSPAEGGQGRGNGKGKQSKNKKGKEKADVKPEKNDRKDKAALQKQQQQLPTFQVHFVPVSIGRDYGNAVEILTGLQGGEHIVESPNDFIQEGAQVKGQKARENPATAPSSSSGKQNANSEKLRPQPGAEPSPQQPSKERMNRGPGQ
jgi:multidrug efflux pump subunit AcrA (membrane-fusion protein)